jgi:hypothetical protein
MLAFWLWLLVSKVTVWCKRRVPRGHVIFRDYLIQVIPTTGCAERCNWDEGMEHEAVDEIEKRSWEGCLYDPEEKGEGAPGEVWPLRGRGPFT